MHDVDRGVDFIRRTFVPNLFLSISIYHLNLESSIHQMSSNRKKGYDNSIYADDLGRVKTPQILFSSPRHFVAAVILCVYVAYLLFLYDYYLLHIIYNNRFYFILFIYYYATTHLFQRLNKLKDHIHNFYIRIYQRIFYCELLLSLIHI